MLLHLCVCLSKWSVSYWNLLKPICLITLWRVFCSNCCWICAISLDDTKICFAIEGKNKNYIVMQNSHRILWHRWFITCTNIEQKLCYYFYFFFEPRWRPTKPIRNSFVVAKKGGILYLKRRKYCQHKKVFTHKMPMTFFASWATLFNTHD